MGNVNDDVKKSFLTSKLPGGIPAIRLERRSTALLVIDMQRMNAHREGKYARWAAGEGIGGQLEYYFSRVEKLVVPNIRQVMKAARQAEVEVVYSRVASVTRDGREMGWRYKAWDMTNPADSEEAQILEELAPHPNDLVVVKTCTSVFLGSHLDRYLRNMGILSLIVCGVATNGCVESAVRDASDLEYSVVVAEDACATLSKDDHDLAVRAMHPLYAQALSTSEITEKIRTECGQTEKTSR